MAPSALCTMREKDCDFLRLASNGISVTLDGKKLQAGVGEYDEHTGKVVTFDHGSLTVLHGKVRAYPGGGA